MPVEGRRSYDVVVERPQAAVGEAFVVVGDLLAGQLHRVQLQAILDERLHLDVGQAGPADPGALSLPDHRLQGRDQAAGAGPPLRLAAGSLPPVHGQAARDDHEAVVAGRLLAAGIVES